MILFSSPVGRRSGRCPLAAGIEHNVPRLKDVLRLKLKHSLVFFKNVKRI